MCCLSSAEEYTDAYSLDSVTIIANIDWTSTYIGHWVKCFLYQWDVTESLRGMDNYYLLFTDGETETLIG